MANLTATSPSALPGFRFRIEAMGFNLGLASKIDGFSVTTDIITYRGGADSHTPRKQKGLTNYSDLTIESISVDSSDVWTWLGLVFEPFAGIFNISSPIYKTDLVITFLDMQGKQHSKFFVKNAWISSFELTNIDANQSNLLIQNVTFAHEGITQVGLDPNA